MRFEQATVVGVPSRLSMRKIATASWAMPSQSREELHRPRVQEDEPCHVDRADRIGKQFRIESVAQPVRRKDVKTSVP